MTDTKTSSKSGESKSEDVAKLAEMIKGIKIAMLTTVDPDGALRSRPMATQEAEFNGQLWFFTREHSGKVQSIQNDQHVNVCYSDVDSQRYISVAGRGSLVTDRETLEKYWNPAVKAWFPEGLEDPELALIRVDVESAEIWDSPPGLFVRLAGFAEAIVTGQPYDQIHGNHNQRMDLDTHH